MVGLEHAPHARYSQLHGSQPRSPARYSLFGLQKTLSAWQCHGPCPESSLSLATAGTCSWSHALVHAPSPDLFSFGLETLHGQFPSRGSRPLPPASYWVFPTDLVLLSRPLRPVFSPRSTHLSPFSSPSGQPTNPSAPTTNHNQQLGNIIIILLYIIFIYYITVR